MFADVVRRGVSSMDLGPEPLHVPISRSVWPKMPVILSVDDDCRLLFLYWQSFGQAGYRCVPCETPKAALEALTILPVALVTLDFDMPGQNGAQLAREIRTLRPKIPIVLITGAESLQDEDLSCFDCVHRKGSPPAQLFAKIRGLLGAASPCA